MIAARSENDTGNNPHNPMYGIAKAGRDGELLTLIGSQNSDSGGNSMAPAMLMDPANRPTKIDRASDVTGLVDTGALGTHSRRPDATRSRCWSRWPASAEQKLRKRRHAGLPTPPRMQRSKKQRQVRLREDRRHGRQRSATRPRSIRRSIRTSPVPMASSAPNFGSDGEFQKTASVMKLVVEGNAGAGTISMGGFDYHTGDRATGEMRDLRAGRCIGACLEFAARNGKPLMIYVFSDGSLSSNGMVDDSVDGRGKGEWTGDNQQTAASFFLVYNPPAAADAARHGNPARAISRSATTAPAATS